MHHRRTRRPVVAVVAGAVGAALAGCGGAGEATVEMRSAGSTTTFVTLAPEPTPAPAEEGGAADGHAAGGDGGDEDDGVDDGLEYFVDPMTGDRIYTIDAGDSLVQIARAFNVTPEAIVAANGWDSVAHRINPGDQIRVPPPHDDDVSDDAPDVSAADDSGDSDGDVSRLPPGICDVYEIQRGDVPGRVAARHGIEVDELAAANADTPNYDSFVVGIDILIPCAQE